MCQCAYDCVHCVIVQGSPENQLSIYLSIYLSSASIIFMAKCIHQLAVILLLSGAYERRSLLL